MPSIKKTPAPRLRSFLRREILKDRLKVPGTENEKRKRKGKMTSLERDLQALRALLGKQGVKMDVDGEGEEVGGGGEAEGEGAEEMSNGEAEGTLGNDADLFGEDQVVEIRSGGRKSPSLISRFSVLGKDIEESEEQSPERGKIKTWKEELQTILEKLYGSSGGGEAVDRGKEKRVLKERRRELIIEIGKVEAVEKLNQRNLLQEKLHNLPSPITESEIKSLRKERDLIYKALAGKEKSVHPAAAAKRIPRRVIQQDMERELDGEELLRLGKKGLARRKRKDLEVTGRWEGSNYSHREVFRSGDF